MLVYFRVSDDFIQSELKAGRIQKREQSIRLEWSELDQETRDLFMLHAVFNTEKESAFLGYFKKTDLNYGHNDVFRADNTAICNGNSLDDVIASMKDFQRMKAEIIAKQKSEIEKKITSFMAGNEGRIFGTGIYRDYSGSFDFSDLKNEYDKYVQKYGEFSVSYDELVSKAHEYELAQLAKKEKRAAEAASEAAAKAEKQAATEAGRSELRTWAETNGSELLKLRIKYNQNWQNIAETEWAIAHTTGFDVWSDQDESDKWHVNNATIEQLKELEKAVSENPDHEIDMIRFKFMYKENTWVGDEIVDYYHKTFLKISVKTPIGTTHLFKEILDAADE